MKTEEQYYQDLLKARSNKLKDDIKVANEQTKQKIKNKIENKKLEINEKYEAKTKNYKKTYKSLQKATEGPKYKMPIEAIKLAFQLRKDVKEGDEGAAFQVAFAFAVIIDIIDLIPIAGQIATYFMKPFLFVFLWGKGAWKVKLMRFVFFALVIISHSFLNMVPWTTIAVAYSYHHVMKKADESKKELKKLEKTYQQATLASRRKLFKCFLDLLLANFKIKKEEK